MSDEEDLVTVYRAAARWEAELVKMHLENEGIPCVLVDQALRFLYPMDSLTSVKVQVFRRDEEEALRIIAEHEGAEEEQ